MLLLQDGDGTLGGAAFLCSQGQRRLLMEPDRLPAATGLSYPESVRTIAADVLLEFAAGPRLPRQWTEAEFNSPPTGLTSALMRELIVSQLSGDGIEVGALASPSPVPLGCRVRYADFFSYEQIVSHFREQPPADLVIPTLRTTFEELEGVADDSQDFIIASHVIEHTRDPIGALARSHRALKTGGKLVLTIPDMRRTFDRHRALTPLSHVIEDWQAPSWARDSEHYQEFTALSGRRTDWEVLLKQQHPIHFHVWVYENFMELIDWICANAAPFESVWSHPTLGDETADFEFYVVLTKGKDVRRVSSHPWAAGEPGRPVG